MPDDRDLSPEQEERVRRLLAEARVDEPIPGDVAGRLDRVLARLADGALDEETAVVDLAARRRRKVTTLLVAAAAVVAVGVGASQLSGPMSSGSDSATSAEAPEAASADQAGGNVVGRDGTEAEPPSALSGSANDLTSSSRLKPATPVRLRPAFFAIDVERVRSGVSAYATGPSGSAGAAQAPEAPAEEGAALDDATVDMCEPAAWGPGDLYVVRYAGSPAVLAFRPPVGDTQVVDLLQCGTADLLRSVTLPGA